MSRCVERFLTDPPAFPFSPPKLDPILETLFCTQISSLSSITGSRYQSFRTPPSLPSVYIPKKAASKTRAPRRRQRKTQRPPLPEAPKEAPPEAVQEYIDIMEGLMGSHLDTGKAEDEEGQLEDAGMYPDLSLLNYIDELCSQEVFVSKVSGVYIANFFFFSSSSFFFLRQFLCVYP